MTHVRFACRFLAATVVLGAIGVAGSAPVPTDPGRTLTIYNQDFAVVQETVPMTLIAGINHVTFGDVTNQVEPDSVVLRDPDPTHNLTVVEQNYRADPITQERLLALYEGKTIDFQVTRGDQTEIVQGRIVRSGYVSQSRADAAMGYYPSGWVQPTASQPLIEVGGKLQFSLPGIPLFPALTDDSILKPTLDWTLVTDNSRTINADLSYITKGLSWEAAYNVQSIGEGNMVDLVGWVSIDNQSGKSFDNTRIKLMAGDVNIISPSDSARQVAGVFSGAARQVDAGPNVGEKSFDEYHLYTLQAPAALLDRETKQIEFIRASGVKANTVYVYDGAYFDPNTNYGYQSFINDATYGTQLNKKVWVLREVENSEANHLGMPIPKGKVRFYRQDDDGSLEFTGEDTVDHTPKNETLRFFTGSASDLTGERKQTNFQVGAANGVNTADESFDIKVRNHKTTPVEIRIVEHLYRGAGWTITDHSNTFLKTDSRTIEFRVPLAPDQDQAVTYTVHYIW